MPEGVERDAGGVSEFADGGEGTGGCDVGEETVFEEVGEVS